MRQFVQKTVWTLWQAFWVIALISALYVCTAGIVAAQDVSQCGMRDTMLAGLLEAYGEQVHVAAIASNGSLVEVLGVDGGTFTIVITRDDGIACAVLNGDGFHVVDPPLVEPAAEGDPL